jgi:hypothetical protein
VTVLAAHQLGLCGHEQLERNHPEAGGISIAPGKVLRQFFSSWHTLFTATRGKKSQRRLGFLGAEGSRLDLGFHQKPGRVVWDGCNHSQPVKCTFMFFPLSLFS